MNTNKNIRPNGLKGKEVNKRMIDLMGIKTINEDVSTSNVELTKLGPDGKTYAIVKENSKYYIKTSDKTTGLIKEDLNYMGGLANKTEFEYPSYSKALKKLNLKFISLNESYSQDINVFKNDNLITENVDAEVNVDADVDLDEEEDVELNETEEEIDRMITGEVVKENHKKGYSIARAIEIMEDITPSNELSDVLETLSESDKAVVLNALKKKA